MSLLGSIAALVKFVNGKARHPRSLPHAVHDGPVHGTCDGLGDCRRHAVTVGAEVWSGVLLQVVRAPIFGLKVTIDRPSNVVQEFRNLARVVEKDAAKEPLKEVVNGAIGLLFIDVPARLI